MACGSIYCVANRFVRQELDHNRITYLVISPRTSQYSRDDVSVQVPRSSRTFTIPCHCIMRVDCRSHRSMRDRKGTHSVSHPNQSGNRHPVATLRHRHHFTLHLACSGLTRFYRQSFPPSPPLISTSNHPIHINRFLSPDRSTDISFPPASPLYIHTAPTLFGKNPPHTHSPNESKDIILGYVGSTFQGAQARMRIAGSIQVC